uniref:MULE transposase domain-containing protein n=1 Tax=Globodera rostochiensis TaxID=31243 RepID=A0A914HKV1_GLORO
MVLLHPALSASNRLAAMNSVGTLLNRWHRESLFRVDGTVLTQFRMIRRGGGHSVDDHEDGAYRGANEEAEQQTRIAKEEAGQRTMRAKEEAEQRKRWANEEEEQRTRRAKEEAEQRTKRAKEEATRRATDEAERQTRKAKEEAQHQLGERRPNSAAAKFEAAANLDELLKAANLGELLKAFIRDFNKHLCLNKRLSAYELEPVFDNFRYALRVFFASIGLTFLSILLVVYRLLSRDEPDHRAIIAQQSGIDFDQFVRDYLKAGKVQIVYVYPDKSIAIAVLQPGALIEGQRYNDSGVLIRLDSLHTNGTNFLRVFEDVQNQIGTDLCNHVPAAIPMPSPSQKTNFLLLLGWCILWALYFKYWRAARRRPFFRVKRRDGTEMAQRAVCVWPVASGRLRLAVCVSGPFASGRLRLAVCVSGCLYVFHMFNADRDVKFWRCEHQRSDVKCRGRVHTSLDDVVLKTVGEHNCQHSAANVAKQQIVTGIKRRAAETMETPAAIRAHALQQIPTPVMSNLPTKNATKKLVKRVRHEIDAPPPVPASIEQLVIPEDYRIYKRSAAVEEPFLLADSGIYNEAGREGQERILIFGRQSFRDWASEMKTIYCDGTFAITPTPFTQVYVILARRDKWVFPVCHCLLTAKTQATYERMFDLLQQCWPMFKPHAAAIDFEQAMVGALKAKHPQCNVNFCLFHLVRNMKKRLAEQGLTHLYNTDAAFSQSARMITSLAFLPIADLNPALAALEDFLPENLNAVLDWFVINYIGRLRQNNTRARPLFQPEQWSVHQRTLDGTDRTNNYAESYHRTLQHAFGHTHPKIWTFIDKLREQQKMIDVNMEHFIAGNAPPPKAKKFRDADRRILSILQRYINAKAALPQVQDDHQYICCVRDTQKDFYLCK